MIDLHTHVLPGIDDGADSMATSLEMLRQAQATGTTHVFCTPHVMDTGNVPSPAEIDDLTDELRAAAVAEGISVELTSGSEVMLAPDLAKRYERGQLRTLGRSQYLLVELPMGSLPHYTGALLFELMVLGLFPVLAHPERNAAFIAQPSQLYDIVAKGVLVQSNVGSLTGLFGPEVQRFVVRLVRAGQVHFLGSDGHSLRRRRLVIAEGRLAAEREIGDEAAALVWRNPSAVVAGREVSVPDPRPVSARGSWLSRFLGRAN